MSTNFNPSTGTNSDYELGVKRGPGGKVERIDFPNGGWKEVDGMGVENGDGSETFTDSRGYEYTAPGKREPADHNVGAQGQKPGNSDEETDGAPEP